VHRRANKKEPAAVGPPAPQFNPGEAYGAKYPVMSRIRFVDEPVAEPL
jgi:hypothetical protein